MNSISWNVKIILAMLKITFKTLICIGVQTLVHWIKPSIIDGIINNLLVPMSIFERDSMVRGMILGQS